MKIKHILFVVVAGTMFFACQKSNNEVQTVKLSTLNDSVSYAIGMQQGQQLLQGINQLELQNDLNKEILIQGFINALKEGTNQIDENQGRIIVQNYVQGKMAEKRARDEAKTAEDYASVKKEGEDFLKENAQRKGVTTTPSGLQYEILKQGKGPKPSINDKVKVHYHGMLIDGTVFDSSVQRGEPAVFGVTQVIQGWVEALQLMPVGSKWKIYVPQQLAYGPRNMGTIKPYSTLIFEVELLEIVK
ncbi:MAG TPA: FKBP-type peptidyl-prolyl cis-trans isomerase [Salinivirgaceae bacterium]|nr:FKBP-type peptidyl-prolyl cis-trans isomerase [Salinivirgaceae bacterium]